MRQIKTTDKKHFKSPGRGLYSYEPDIIATLRKTERLNLSLAEEAILWLPSGHWETPEDIFRAGIAAGWVAIDWTGRTGNSQGQYITKLGWQARKRLYNHIRRLVKEVANEQ